MGTEASDEAQRAHSDCNAADLQMPPPVQWAAVREPVLPQSSSSSSHDIAAGAAPTLPPDFPTIDEICSAPWTTTRFIPPELRDAWTAIFVEELRKFVRRPCCATLAMLFLSAKALLAGLRRGGKSRSEAARRVLRARINAWKAGQIPSIWERLVKENRPRPPHLHPQSSSTPAPARYEHVAQLVDSGLLSKAAAQLCSRGIAEDTDDNYEKIQRLFPQSAAASIVPVPEAATTDVEEAVLRKIISQTPKGLAPGPSGLHVEHLRLAVTGRQRQIDPIVLTLLTMLTRGAQWVPAGKYPSVFLWGQACAHKQKRCRDTATCCWGMSSRHHRQNGHARARW